MKRTKFAKSLVAISALVSTLVMVSSVSAQTQPGKAEIRAVTGTAYYAATPGAPLQALKANQVLGPGATIKTGPGATVDVFLGKSAGIVRVVENTTLSLDKLTLTDTGADTVVEVQLNLPQGTILGEVHKLATASKFEIKVPNGVAGIRGTKLRISSTGYIVLLDGTVIFVYVGPSGPVPYTLQAPPPVYFSPIEGVKPAPDELVREVLHQFGGKGPGEAPPLGERQRRPLGNLNQDPAVPGETPYVPGPGPYPPR